MTLSLSLAMFFSKKRCFHILFSSASRANPTQEGLWWTEGSFSGTSIITRLPTRNVL